MAVGYKAARVILRLWLVMHADHTVTTDVSCRALDVKTQSDLAAVSG